jgi:hypothetical protein
LNRKNWKRKNLQWPRHCLRLFKRCTKLDALALLILLKAGSPIRIISELYIWHGIQIQYLLVNWFDYWIYRNSVPAAFFFLHKPFFLAKFNSQTEDYIIIKLTVNPIKQLKILLEYVFVNSFLYMYYDGCTLVYFVITIG